LLSGLPGQSFAAAFLSKYAFGLFRAQVAIAPPLTLQLSCRFRCGGGETWEKAFVVRRDLGRITKRLAALDNESKK